MVWEEVGLCESQIVKPMIGGSDLPDEFLIPASRGDCEKERPCPFHMIKALRQIVGQLCLTIDGAEPLDCLVQGGGRRPVASGENMLTEPGVKMDQSDLVWKRYLEAVDAVAFKELLTHQSRRNLADRRDADLVRSGKLTKINFRPGHKRAA